MSQFFKVTNHEKYQHYKDRCPPWVKLHASVLEDYDFGCLPDASKAHAMLIWVLASRHNNRLPFDARWVAQQIQATEPVDLDALVSAGFIEMYQDASTTLAPLVQRTEDRGQKQITDAKASGEADRKTDLAFVMGAIRNQGYLSGKPPRRGDDARDATVARHLLGSHPAETVARAVEGARALVERGELPPLKPGEPFTLRLLNAMWGGKSVFTMALDAYYAQGPPEPTKRERSQPTGLTDDMDRILRKLGAKDVA